MMDVTTFYNSWNGHQCCDGGLCECVALGNEWCDTNGWPRPSGNTAATLAWPAGWRQVDFVDAQAGDLVIYSLNLPGSNGDGHIDLFMRRVDAQTYVGFDQNWGESPTYCHEVTHGAGDTQYVQAVWRYEDVLDPNDPIVKELMQRVRNTENLLIFAPDESINGQNVHPRIALTVDIINELLYTIKPELDAIQKAISGMTGGGGGGLTADQAQQLAAIKAAVDRLEAGLKGA